MVVFKMREIVPTARYSPVCNVLCQWKTSLILTYRVYRLYDTCLAAIIVYYYRYILYVVVPHVIIVIH